MESLKNKTYQLLRRSESFFKTDMVYLAKGGFWITVGQIFITIASFGIAVAFANLLPATTYGSYQFVLATSGILSASTLSGLNMAAVRSIARGAEGVILSSLKTKLRWGSLGSLGSIIIAVYYFWQGNQQLGISFLIVSAFLPLFYSLGISGSLLDGKRLFKINVRNNILNQLFAALTIILALLFTDNLFVLLAVYFGSWTLARLATFVFTVDKYKSNERIDPEMFSYGKHLSVMGIIGTIADNLDKLLLFHFVGTVEVAMYSFAIAPVMQIKGLLKNVSTLALPKLSLRSKEQIQKMILGRSIKIFFLSLPIVIIYVIAAPYIYQIFFPTYLESVIYSQVFVFAILFTASGTLSASSLESQMEVKKKYVLTFFSKISKIILMIVLIIPYGIWGIIWAITLNSIIVTIAGIWLVKK